MDLEEKLAEMDRQLKSLEKSPVLKQKRDVEDPDLNPRPAKRQKGTVDDANLGSQPPKKGKKKGKKKQGKKAEDLDPE